MNDNALIAWFFTCVTIYLILPELRKLIDSKRYGRLISRIEQLEQTAEYWRGMYENALSNKVKRNGRQGQLSFDLGVKPSNNSLVKIELNNGESAFFRHEDIIMANNEFIPVERPSYDSRSGRKIKVTSLWVKESDLEKNDQIIPFESLAVKNRKN